MVSLIRILIADDSPQEREILREYLARFPELCQTIAEAGNGAEAVRLAGATRPDLILLDVRMPLTDGIEAARQIRAAGVPALIITYTGYAGQGIKERALAAGAAIHLTKPFNLDDLHQVIRELAAIH